MDLLVDIFGCSISYSIFAVVVVVVNIVVSIHKVAVADYYLNYFVKDFVFSFYCYFVKICFVVTCFFGWQICCFGIVSFGYSFFNFY
jgi:hypothetical protein